MDNDEARAFLHALFPGGLRDAELHAELCPAGWGRSPLFACYHPPAEMGYQEYLDHRETMRQFDRNARDRKGQDGDFESPFEGPELSFEEFKKQYADGWGKRSGDVDPEEEPAELLGLCLWDVFSDNHEVVAADGRKVDLGSFRGTAAEIAEFFDDRDSDDGEGNEEDGIWSGRDGSDYMRFYMGTLWLGRRADLAPVYRLIFERLKGCGADWRFSLPALRLFEPGEIAEHLGIPYAPSAAAVTEAESEAHESKRRRMRAKLDRANLAAQREARKHPPPATVRAYQEVYGGFPAGWPPDPYQLE